MGTVHAIMGAASIYLVTSPLKDVIETMCSGNERAVEAV